MDANQRLDYFRSELVGKIDLGHKETEELEKRLSLRIKELEDKVDKLSRRVHELAM